MQKSKLQVPCPSQSLPHSSSKCGHCSPLAICLATQTLDAHSHSPEFAGTLPLWALASDPPTGVMRGDQAGIFLSPLLHYIIGKHINKILKSLVCRETITDFALETGIRPHRTPHTTTILLDFWMAGYFWRIPEWPNAIHKNPQKCQPKLKICVPPTCYTKRT